MFADGGPLLHEDEIARTSSALNCQRACQNMEGCKFFTWVSPLYIGGQQDLYENNMCLLRSKDDFPVDVSGMTSGPDHCPIVDTDNGFTTNMEGSFCGQSKDTSESRDKLSVVIEFTYLKFVYFV